MWNNTTQGGRVRRGVMTRVRSVAARTWRNRRDWRWMRRRRPRRRRSGKGRRRQQWRRACKKAARESYMGKPGPAGATLGNPPHQAPTTRERGAAMGKGRREVEETRKQGGKHASKTSGVWETTGAARPPEWPTSPSELWMRRGPARTPEWRETLGGAPGSGRGVELSQGNDTPRVT